MKSPSQIFEQELDIFRTEADTVTQFFAAELAIHEVARNNETVYTLLNRAPLFWNTAVGALQTAGFVALGRIFDQESPHNIDILLNLAEKHIEIFTKRSFALRRQGNAPTLPDYLDEYLAGVYEPTPADFRLIRKQVAAKRHIYEKNYREIRNLVFAHKIAASPVETTPLFAKTLVVELNQLRGFLLDLHETLWQLYANGRKPEVPLRDSGHDLESRLKEEVQRFLTICSTGESDKWKD